MVQWVKNPNAAAQVAVEAWVGPSAQELPYTLGAAIKKKKMFKSILALKTYQAFAILKCAIIIYCLKGVLNSSFSFKSN